MLLLVAANPSFQHTAARRRLVFWVYNLVAWFEFQHTAARRRLVGRIFKTADSMTVSTHSRPKAAGTDCRAWRSLYVRCFNTQPPEGGWILFILNPTWLVSFNTQPPEGGWMTIKLVLKLCLTFQHTAARRRLVAKIRIPFFPHPFQHTAARRRLAGSNTKSNK